jgi:hypothetical protein
MAGAHGRAPLPLGARPNHSDGASEHSIAGVHSARPRLRVLPAVAPVVVGSVATNTAAASDGLPAAEQDRTKPRIDSHGSHIGLPGFHSVSSGYMLPAYVKAKCRRIAPSTRFSVSIVSLPRGAPVMRFLAMVRICWA